MNKNNRTFYISINRKKKSSLLNKNNRKFDVSKNRNTKITVRYVQRTNTKCTKKFCHINIERRMSHCVEGGQNPGMWTTLLSCELHPKTDFTRRVPQLFQAYGYVLRGFVA
jgi:hypothetical protein